MRLLVDGAIVALAANLGNLFDRRPGRCIKVGAIGFVLVVIAGAVSAVLAATAVVVGAALALVLDDLHERLMLGDAGANTLGAVLGVAAISDTADSTKLLILIVLLALNLLSEVVSFSKLIDSVPPLRRADQAGRPRSPASF